MILFEKFFEGKEFEWKPGLERIEKAISDFGGKNYPSIIVAGTNGKGSVSHMVSRVLENHGLRVGLFTSPHLFRFNERIKVNSKEVGDEVLNDAFKSIRPIVEKRNLTYFEASLLLALAVFKEFGVECGVFEVGLGGRLDATNVLNHQVGVITSIGFDHKNFLGDTLEEIALEKISVVKDGMDAVLSKGTYLPNVKEYLENLSVNSYLYGKDFWEDEVLLTNFKTSFYYMSQIPVATNLLGKHQAVNGACALKASAVFLEKYLGIKFNIPKTLQVFLPGRLEVLRKSPILLFDVAHNQDALRTLFSTLRELGISASVFYGGLKDKEQEKNLLLVKEYLDWSKGSLFLVEIENERGLKEKDLVNLATGLGLNFELVKRIDIKEIDFPAVITGSFYLAGKVWK